MLMISLAIQFLFVKRYDFSELRTIATSSFGVFSVVYIIFSNINLDCLKIWLNENACVKRKNLLFGITFTAFLLIATYNYSQLDAVDGKIRLILPDGNIKEITLKEAINKDLQYLFPELSEIPFCGFETYATNGKANSTFHPEGIDGRPCVEIKFKNNYNTTESNSGWMITPLQGYDARKFAYLSFWVKGRNGEERFGIGMKDLIGNEVKVDSIEYLGQEKLTRYWQKVYVKLEHFDNNGITSNLNVISLYSNGEMHYGLDSETIYVADFDFST